MFANDVLVSISNHGRGAMSSPPICYLLSFLIWRTQFRLQLSNRKYFSGSQNIYCDNQLANASFHLREVILTAFAVNMIRASLVQTQ